MKTRLVTLENIAPKGSQDRCFHCNSLLDHEHLLDCVLLRKSIRLRVTIEYDTQVPEFWDKEAIEWFYNESTHCANNELGRIADQYNYADDCLCQKAKFEYLRLSDSEMRERMEKEGNVSMMVNHGNL